MSNGSTVDDFLACTLKMVEETQKKEFWFTKEIIEDFRDIGIKVEIMKRKYDAPIIRMTREKNR